MQIVCEEYSICENDNGDLGGNCGDGGFQTPILDVGIGEVTVQLPVPVIISLSKLCDVSVLSLECLLAKTRIIFCS